MKKLLVGAALGLALALICLRDAPGFLSCSDPPGRADAVVLFLGPEQVERFDEAMRLVRSGYATHLVIPSFGLTLDPAGAQALEKDHKGLRLKERTFWVRKAVTYRRYYENTHVEALEARRLMERHGFRSALVVSSRYHMRRLKLITGRVFDPEHFRLAYVPCRFQPGLGEGDWTSRDRRKVIIGEYLKIAWFLLYSTVG
ncbi:YdcF family protein [Geomesophilobacter sediminis]|uniref:YdcF family protein n=1 Tax=Geomesophilobacter sediminis TaxID=2798584 RepID=A0A8J7J698_9BACT|nr:YdcF family protein [Geomesophilobacter sediminis]MBJ6724256.1 YdcF family protein [Geomesophilobacter sediminis]